MKPFLIFLFSVVLLISCGNSTKSKPTTTESIESSNAIEIQQNLKKDKYTLDCEKKFSDMESEIQKIRDLYYGLDHKKLSKEVYNTDDNRTTYYFNEEDYLKKIVREESGLTNTYSEFCVQNGDVYFIYIKTTDTKNDKVEEYRFYINNGALMQVKYMLNGKESTDKEDQYCSLGIHYFKHAYEVYAQINELRNTKREIAQQEITEAFSSPNFMLATEEGYLVLCPFDDDISLFGELTYIKPGQTFCEVDHDDIPKEYFSLLNKEVYLYTSEGVEVSIVNNFAVASKFVPYFGEYSNVNPEAEPKDDATLAQEAFNDGRAQKYLVAECNWIPKNATVYGAKLASLGDFGTIKENNTALVEKAKKELLACDDYKAIQKDYEAFRSSFTYDELVENWEDYASLKIKYGTTKRLDYAFVQFKSGDECSDMVFGEELSAIYIKIDGEIQVLDIPFEGILSSISDINNDGYPEFLVYKIDGVEFHYLNENLEFNMTEYIVPFYDCGC